MSILSYNLRRSVSPKEIPVSWDFTSSNCLDRLEDNENCDKRASLQKLLELLRTTVYYDELLIYKADSARL